MTGFSGGQIPPKFTQLPRQDLGPLFAEIEITTKRLARQLAREEDSRIAEVLEEAFCAGINFAQGGRDFNEWLDEFIARQQEGGD